MNIKIFMHLMPWELDDAFSTFNKLGFLKKIIKKEDNLQIHTCLNLSSYLIDWNKSIIPKQLIIDKYHYINKTLYECDVITKIYDGNSLYGHLDFQREIIDEKTDYYISICPDVYFHPHTIYYLIESAKTLNNKYFLITPEIPRLWDTSWDFLVNKNLLSTQCSNWNKQDIHELIYMSQNIEDGPYLEKTPEFKWAGWCDLYNKNFYEKLVPCQENWHGYGPWDLFGMNVANISKQHNVDISQFVLRNQVIFDKDIGVYENKKNNAVYKSYLSINNIPDQRAHFESNLKNYIRKWIEYAASNKII